MKKTVVLFYVFAFAVFTVSQSFAGGIINKQNFSAEYLRTLSRNAATDAADAVVYNPAGVIRMEDGAYANLSVFYADKRYSNEIDTVKLETTEPSIVPGLFALYKQDEWAFFGALTIPAGGGKVKYDDGNARTHLMGVELADRINAGYGMTVYDELHRQSLEADSVYYGLSFGGAHKINSQWSIAGGIRYIDASKSAEGTVTLASSGGFASDLTANVKYEQTATGWGGFLGVDFAPSDTVNIGIRFETPTNLTFKTDEKRDQVGNDTNAGLIEDGEENREDLPGLIGVGVSFRFATDFKLDTSFTYYLESDAELQNIDSPSVDNGFDLATSLEYAFNERWRGSLGFMRTTTYITADDMLLEAPELDATSVCIGFAYSPIDDMTVNCALMQSLYDKRTRSDGIGLEKKVIGFALGIEYRFM